MIDGSIDGTFDGPVDGRSDGMIDGKVDGTSDGKIDGSIDGAFDGPVDGRSDGMIDGKVDGTSDGKVDGSIDGAFEGPVDGTSDGKVDGNIDGAFDGPADGRSDGMIDGKVDGTLDGVLDGKVDGTIDGVCDGTKDGVSEGTGVTRPSCDTSNEAILVLNMPVPSDTGTSFTAATKNAGGVSPSPNVSSRRNRYTPGSMHRSTFNVLLLPEFNGFPVFSKSKLTITSPVSTLVRFHSKSLGKLSNLKSRVNRFCADLQTGTSPENAWTKMADAKLFPETTSRPLTDKA